MKISFKYPEGVMEKVLEIDRLIEEWQAVVIGRDPGDFCRKAIEICESNESLLKRVKLAQDDIFIKELLRIRGILLSLSIPSITVTYESGDKRFIDLGKIGD